MTSARARGEGVSTGLGPPPARGTGLFRAPLSNQIKKRKRKNRYDKLSKDFYVRAQNAFIKIAKKNKRKYSILDNSKDSDEIEKAIIKRFNEVLEK